MKLNLLMKLLVLTGIIYFLYYLPGSAKQPDGGRGIQSAFDLQVMGPDGNKNWGME